MKKIKIKNLLNITNSVNLISVPCLFFALYAVYGNILAFSNAMYSINFMHVCTFIIYMCIPFGLYLIFIKQKRNIAIDNLVLLILPLTYLMIQIMHTYNGYKGEWMTAFIVICLFCLLSDRNKSIVFEYTYRIILITNAIAIALYIINIIFPNLFEKVPYYSDQAVTLGLNYTKIGIFAIYGNRLCSIFNEPGGLGTICAFLFIITFKKSTKYEKINLLVCGSLTFSLAFFILVYAFFMIYLLQKDIRYFIPMLLLAVLFFMIPYIDFHNDAINMFVARTKIVNGSLAGNNRTTKKFDYLYNEMKNSKEIIWGRGVGYILAEHVSTFKTYIVQMGLIGTGAILAEWIVCALVKANRSRYNYIFLALFILSAYQRPNIAFTLTGYLLIFGGFAWQNDKGNGKLNVYKK